MSKIILKRNTLIAELINKADDLRDKCGVLYRECRDTGVFNSAEHDRLAGEIEWTEYLLWGARNGIYR